MVRERAKVRPTGARWRATLPRFGFGPPETKTFDTQYEACTWARRCVARQLGSTGAIGMVDAERAHRWDDGIAPLPAWTPLYPAVW